MLRQSKVKAHKISSSDNWVLADEPIHTRGTAYVMPIHVVVPEGTTVISICHPIVRLVATPSSIVCRGAINPAPEHLIVLSQANPVVVTAIS